MKNFFHKAPFLRIAIPFAAGNALGFVLQPSLFICVVLLGISGFAAMLLASLNTTWITYRKNHFFGWLSVVAFFVAGTAWSGYRLDARQYHNAIDTSGVLFEGKVLSFPAEKSNTTALELELIAVVDSIGQTRALDTKILAYAHSDLRADTLLPGDRVIFKKVPEPHRRALNPYQFDYGKYLIFQGFTATVYLRDEVGFNRPEHHSFSVGSFFQTYRRSAIALFEERDTSPAELGVIAALVLGKRDMVDDEIRKAFTDAGTIHILAVSGLHVGIIYFFAAFLIGRVFRGEGGRWFRLIFCLVILWLYAGIAGFSPSVLRAATMFSFIAAGREFGRLGNVYNMLGVSAFLLLLANPFLIGSVGFLLSYLAVTGIVMLHPVIYSLWVAPTWFLDKVWSLTVVSFSAQLATFPVTVHFFHQFPNYFLFSNLLVIPLATILLYAGLICIMLSWVPYLSDVLFLSTEWVARGLNEGVLLFAKLPHPVSEGLYLSAGETATLYLLAIAVALALRDPRRGRLRFAQAATLLFFFQFGFRKIKSCIATEVYCFHVEKTSVVGVFRGSTAHLYSPDSAGTASRSVDFALGGILAAKGIRNKDVYENWSSIESPAVSVVAVESMEELRTAAAKAPNFILLRGKWSETGDWNIRIDEGTAIVIDGAVPSYRRDYLSARLREAGIPFQTTAEVGAIRL